MRDKRFHTINTHKPLSLRLDEKKLSIEYCRKKLLKNGLNFTDKQVELIREFLYLLAEIEYQHYKKNSHEEESNPLHPRLD
jgi:hypothetical protein